MNQIQNENIYKYKETYKREEKRQTRENEGWQ